MELGFGCPNQYSVTSLFERSNGFLPAKRKKRSLLHPSRAARLVCQLGYGNDHCRQALREVRFFQSLVDSFDLGIAR